MGRPSRGAQNQYGVWRNGLRAFLRLLLTQQSGSLAKLTASRRLVLGQQIGGRAPAGLMIEIDAASPNLSLGRTIACRGSFHLGEGRAK